MKFEKSKNPILAMAATMALCAVCFAGIVALDADGSSADTDYGSATNISIAPGMRYTYTPEWPADVGTVTTVVELQKSGSLTGSNVSIATMSSGTLTVNIPRSAAVGTVYHVVLKATTVSPAQTAFIYITFTITSNLSVSGSQSDVSVGDSISMTPSASGMGTKIWAVKSGTSLPTGLTLDTTTGKVSGKITTPGSYSIQLTCTSSYGEVANLTVSFKVTSKLAPLNSPLGGMITVVF